MMPKILVLAAAALLGSRGSLGAQRTASELITRAATAMGGVAALDALANKTFEFNAANFALGQEETPLSPPRATLVSGRTVHDYAGLRTTTSQEQRLFTGAINRFRRTTTRDISVVETNGVQQRDPASVSANLERGLSLELERVMLAAIHHPSAATLLRPKMLRGEVANGIRMALGPDTLDVWFDRATGLPFATERLGDDDILGDRRTVTWYTRWQPADGVVLPRQIDVEVNGRLLSHGVITSLATDTRLDERDFGIPDSPRTKTPPPAPSVTVTLVGLAPGVWRAEGGSHHSLVVEQGNGLLVIEAPQSTARGNALLDTLRRRFLGRRISAVVMTHHHHDHSAGIRAFMARAIPVIAHERNVVFVRGIATARTTVAPDRLSHGAPVPSVTAVRDSLVIGSGAARVVVYSLPTTHAEGVLAAWVPSAGAVFTSDVLTLAANQPAVSVGSTELVTFARARGLRPSVFAGGHGAIGAWSLLEAAAR